MKRETFNRIQSIVGVFLLLLMVISVIRDTYVLASIGVTLSIATIVLAKKQMNEVRTDERTVLIQQKASTITLSIFSILAAISGLVFLEFSYRGYEHLRGYGFFLLYLVMGVVSLNSLLRWYYGRQLGD